jgi:hypothetical protein
MAAVMSFMQTVALVFWQSAIAAFFMPIKEDLVSMPEFSFF